MHISALKLNLCRSGFLVFSVQNDPATNSDPFVLVLENVTIKDHGWYTCLVGNTMGYSLEFFWLTVMSRTSPRFL